MAGIPTQTEYLKKDDSGEFSKYIRKAHQMLDEMINTNKAIGNHLDEIDEHPWSIRYVNLDEIQVYVNNFSSRIEEIFNNINETFNDFIN